MHIWNRIRRLSISQLTRFTLLFIRNPLKIIPTLQATKRTFAICNELFRAHHNAPNKANAFRHALWNVLICQKTNKIIKNKQKSVFWAQIVTELYEKVTNNAPLDEAMDLHNNAIGRICFLNFLDQNEAEIIKFLHKKTENAKKVIVLEEIAKTQQNMVYLHD